MKLGLKQADASHVACAGEAGCEFFPTTDRRIHNKSIPDIQLVNPIDFVRRQQDDI